MLSDMRKTRSPISHRLPKISGPHEVLSTPRRPFTTYPSCERTDRARPRYPGSRRKSSQSNSWKTRNVGNERASLLAAHEPSLLSASRQEVSQLRRTRHQGVRPLAAFVCKLLCRSWVCPNPRALHRTNRQRWRLRAGQLPLGRSQAAKQEQADKPCSGVQRATQDRGRVVGDYWLPVQRHHNAHRKTQMVDCKGVDCPRASTKGGL